MPPVVEVRADAALVAVLTVKGDIRGTGFVIDGSGTVLTCHHVVDGLTSVLLRGPNGTTHAVSSDAVVVAPEIDLALIRAPALLGSPLPLVSAAEATTEYWTKGFHREGQAIRAAFPVQGRMPGRTNVSYLGDNFRYDIDDVFVLRDDVIDHGLSGAPVLDRTAGVVVGVVSSNLARANEAGGFAIPISHAAAHPELAAAVAANQASVAAYGPYLNAPAARELCTAVTGHAIENLTYLRRVDLAKRVARADVEDAIGQFLAGDAPVLALIGPSGVGKSTELAALTQQILGRALLLCGSSLRSDCTSLGEAVKDAIIGESGGLPMPDAADAVVADALRDDSGLIVVLDALNEAPMSGQAFEEWAGRTRFWLQDTHARLVISCRPELWADLVGRPLSADLSGRKPVVVQLGGFTSQEYENAARVYDLPLGTDWSILHLPLALSLWSRSQRAPMVKSGAGVSLNDVIEAYALDAARRLVKTRVGPPSSAQVMQDRLVEAAAQMWERGTDVLDMQAFGEIFGSATTPDAMVMEGVMTSTPTGYRFAYDDLGDWLQAQRLDLDREFVAIVHGSGPSWQRAGPISSALRDIERREGAEALRSRLTELIRDADKFDSPAFRIVEETLIKVADARPYSTVLDLIVDGTIDMLSSVIDNPFMSMTERTYSVGFWSSVPIPLAQRLNLLRRLIPMDHYYGSRKKDWVLSPRFDDESYSKLVYDLVQQDPTVGIAALLPWLSDLTEMVKGEATVAEFAMGVFYRFRRRTEDAVWSAMIKAGARCEYLIREIAEHDPQWLVREVSSELKGDDYTVLLAGLLLAQRSSLPDEDAKTWRRAVAGRYARGLDVELQGMALNALVRGEGGQGYTEPVLRAYQDGIPGVGAFTLASAAAHDTEIVLPVLVEALEREPERRNDALYALGTSDDARIQAAGDRAVRRYLEKRSDVEEAICEYAERRLWRSDAADDNLLAIVRRVMAAKPKSGRHILGYVLTDPNRLGDWSQKVMLLREFIDGPADLRATQIVAMKLVQGVAIQNPMPDTLALLQRALARVDASSADRILFSLATAYGDVIARWLTSGKLSPSGEYTMQLKERLRAGEDPEDAAEKIMEDYPDESFSG